jgi:site-specific DNA-adenine methylase
MDEEEFTSALPIIKYPGGKLWLLPFVQAMNLPRSGWVVPFCGPCTLELALGITGGLFADANPYVVYALEWLQSGAVRRINCEFSSKGYSSLRAWFNTCKDNSSRLLVGEMFWLLSLMSHKGIWRVNRQGFHNVPWGSRKKLASPPIHECASRMRGWTIKVQDFCTTLSEAEPDQVIFLDPPYLDVFVQYTPAGFDLERTAAMLEMVDQHQGPIISCNGFTAKAYQLHRQKGFDCYVVDSGQRVHHGQGSLKSQAKQRREIISLKNCTPPPGFTLMDNKTIMELANA